MTLWVNGDYIADVEVEMERKVMLLEEAGNVQGDFSYSFSITNTAEIAKKLGLESFNSLSRTKYKKIHSELKSGGNTVYTGYLMITRVTDSIECSFFSGNSDWFEILNFPLRDLNLSTIDTDQTQAAIIASWLNNSGIVWPLTDRGALGTRESKALYEEDFQPFLFVKDLLEAITVSTSVKIKGGILKDPIFNSLITSNNGLSGLRARIEARSVYAGTSTAQSLTTTLARLEFNDLSSPFFNSPRNNWDAANDIYLSDENYKRIKVEWNLSLDSTPVGVRVSIILNGAVSVYTKVYLNTALINDSTELIDQVANATSIELQVEEIGISFTADVQAGSWIKVTPVKFFTVFAEALLPDMPVGDFLVQIFKLFNAVISYDSNSRTISAYTFSSVIKRTPIDLSQYVSKITETNYSDFVSGYAKRNLITYAEQTADEIEDYNLANPVPYGGGLLSIDNDFLEENSDLFELDFIACLQKTLPGFSASLPFLGYAETTETDTTRDITSVTDNGDGFARINWTVGGAVGSNALIRLSGMTNDVYNGDWRVIINNSLFVVCQDLQFDTDATGTLTLLEITDVDNSDQALLLYVPSRPVNEFMGASAISFEAQDKSSMAFAYFYLPNLNLQVNRDVLKYAMYFDPVNDGYQIGLKQQYYSEIEDILNDPAVILAEMFLPYGVFLKLDFITPVILKTDKITGLFFTNRFTGYKDQQHACIVELVKLP